MASWELTKENVQPLKRGRSAVAQGGGGLRAEEARWCEESARRLPAPR